jgi:hypothetical protein
MEPFFIGSWSWGILIRGDIRLINGILNLNWEGRIHVLLSLSVIMKSGFLVKGNISSNVKQLTSAKSPNWYPPCCKDVAEEGEGVAEHKIGDTLKRCVLT